MTVPQRMRPVAAWASPLLALAASTAFVLLPTGTSTSSTSGPTGSPSSTVVTHHTLLEHEGSSVLVVLAVPVLVAALGAVVPSRAGRAVVAFVLWAFCVLGAASVGLFYVPAAAAMTAAAFLGAQNTK